MNETNFKYLEDVKNYKIRFKCFKDSRDGYQAVFYVDDKINSEKHYKIDFCISGTNYVSDIKQYGKSTGGYIDEKYGNIENCFKEIGIKYIEEKIKQDDVKDNKEIDIVPHLA
jgi:hypothetical protein